MSAKLLAVRSIRMLLVLCLLANSRVVAAPLPAALPPAGWQEITKGNLTLELPRDWQPFGSSAPDEGRWRTGAGAASGSLRIVRDRPFERLKTGMAVTTKEATTLAGRAATRHTGVVGEGVSQRQAIAVVQDTPAADGSLLAIVCEAPVDRWSDLEPAFLQILYTARQVGMARPDYPPATSTAVARWYLHGRGGFRIGLPAGWRVDAAQARTEHDADFDTVYDDSGEVAVVIGRLREKVANADAALTRWQKERLSQLKQPVKQERLQVAGQPTLSLSYRESSGAVAASRLSIVAFGYRYPLTIYAPARDQEHGPPPKILQWLDGIEFLHTPAAQERWQTVNVGPVTMRLPERWKPLETDAAASIARWGLRDEQERNFTVTLERSTDATALRDRIAKLQRYFPVQAGAVRGYAYGGIVHQPLGHGMTVVFDATDDQGRYLALSFRADGDTWPRYEWEAMQVIITLRLSAVTPRAAGSPVGLGKLLTRYERIDGFRGEQAYGLTCYTDGIELRSLDTGRTESARIAFASLPPHEQLQPLLEKDPSLADRLGPANSDRIALFDDAVRVQLFEGGVILTETATRATWWCTHHLRTAP